MPDPKIIDETAARHGLSPGAVRALADSLARSNGGGAQWNHPDLGGMGQWSRGGMIQIGDMFDNGLKARVAAAIEDLVRAGPTIEGGDGAPLVAAPGPWWPGELGDPAASGAQNDMRYACFPQARRLVVQRGGTVTVYDTGAHRLTGVSQAQGAGQTLEFSGPDGRVALVDLTALR